MRTRFVIAAMTLFGAVACTPEADVARYTVEEYRADTGLRRQVFTECANDPGTLGQTADCINAIEAERLESRGSLRDQPPVGLNPESR